MIGLVRLAGCFLADLGEIVDVLPVATDAPPAVLDALPAVGIAWLHFLFLELSEIKSEGVPRSCLGGCILAS